jgi:hypothetical protein
MTYLVGVLMFSSGEKKEFLRKRITVLGEEKLHMELPRKGV